MKAIPRLSPDPTIRKQQLQEMRLKQVEADIKKIHRYLNWKNRTTKHQTSFNDINLRANKPDKKALGSDQ